MSSTDDEKRREQIKELTLLLMYLTSWEENPYAGLHGLTKKQKQQLSPEQLAETYRACWKGYDFDVLNELSDDGLLKARGRGKTAYFTQEGEDLAAELLAKYHIAEGSTP